MSDLDDVDWEQEQSEDEILQIPTLSIEPKQKKRKLAVYTENDKKAARKQHKTELHALFKRSIKRFQSDGEDKILSFLTTQLPEEFMHQREKGGTQLLLQVRDWFHHWFFLVPNDDVSEEEGRDGCDLKTLENIFSVKAGTLCQLNQLFFWILRTLSFDCRLLFTLDPLPPRPSFISSTTTSSTSMNTLENSRGNRKKVRSAAELIKPTGTNIDTCPSVENFVDGKKDESVCEDSVKRKNRTQGWVDIDPICWTEVLVEAEIKESAAPPMVFDLTDDASPTSVVRGSLERRWVPVEPMRGVFHSHEGVERLLRLRRAALAYVLALERDGKVKDVTFQYAQNPVRTRARRLDGTDSPWWDKLLQRHNTQYQDGEKKEPLESAILETSEKKIPIPTSVAAFKTHPKYILLSQLGKTQVLSPLAKPRGLFKGQLIYLREDVADLKTERQWRKSLKVVRAGEEPFKVVPVQGRKGDKGGEVATEGETKREMKLFATWQVQAAENSPLERVLDLTDFGTEDAAANNGIIDLSEDTCIPGTVDSRNNNKDTTLKDPKDNSSSLNSGSHVVITEKIPTNEHGNIEVWDADPRWVPKGAVYLPDSNTKAVAEELGLQFVPALTGFSKETRGWDRTVTKPVIQGGVVLERDLEVLVKELRRKELEKAKMVAERRETKAVKNWRRLVQLKLSREKLRIQYGY